MSRSTRNARKSPKPQPTSSTRRPAKSPNARSASKRFSCEDLLRNPRPRWSKPKRRTLSSYQRAACSGCEECIASHRRLPDDLAAARAAIEQEVERGEPRQERPRAALGIFRRAEVLPLHAHAGGGEGLLVEVAARSAHPAEERGRAHLPADVEEEPRALAFDR